MTSTVDRGWAVARKCLAAWVAWVAPIISYFRTKCDRRFTRSYAAAASKYFLLLAKLVFSTILHTPILYTDLHLFWSGSWNVDHPKIVIFPLLVEGRG